MTISDGTLLKHQKWLFSTTEQLSLLENYKGRKDTLGKGKISNGVDQAGLFDIIPRWVLPERLWERAILKDMLLTGVPDI